MAKHSKFNTEELKYILNQFVKDEKHKTIRLNFSNLALYAKEKLELSGIEYYHFSRDKEINKLVKDYNKTLKGDSLKNLRDNSTFTSLNIKEFVKMYGGSQEKLTFYLGQLLESQKNLYDSILKLELEKKTLEEELGKIKVKKEVYRNKCRELTSEMNNLQVRHKILADALNHEEEKQFLSALKYTNVQINEDFEIEEYDEDIKDIEKQKDLEKFLNNYTEIFE